MTTSHDDRNREMAGQQQTKALQISHEREGCALALMHLCLIKERATFSPEQSDCWVTILSSMYTTETVNQACLYLAFDTDPFPDLSKIVARCEHIEAEKNPQPVRGEVSTKPSKRLIANAAKALGLKI